MATTEEIEKYCRNCVSRDFVNGKGLVCSRTRDLPAFKEECESFQKDEELEKMAVRTYEQRTTIRYQVSEISAFYPDCW